MPEGQTTLKNLTKNVSLIWLALMIAWYTDVSRQRESLQWPTHFGFEHAWMHDSRLAWMQMMKKASSFGPAVVASLLCPAIGCAFGVYMQSKREALYRWPKHVEKNGCLNLGQNRYIRHALQICSLPNIQPTRLTCKFVGDKSSMFPRMFNMTIRSCKVQHIRTTCGIDLHKFLLAATLQLSIFWFLMLTK